MGAAIDQLKGKVTERTRELDGIVATRRCLDARRHAGAGGDHKALAGAARDGQEVRRLRRCGGHARAAVRKK
eukprot:2913293-Prymnesium_polylepis.3